MKKYSIVFKFISGDFRSFTIGATDYNEVATKIMSDDSWFGVKGDLVNLRNVTTVTIKEIEDREESDPYPDTTHDEFMKWI